MIKENPGGSASIDSYREMALFIGEDDPTTRRFSKDPSV